MFEVIITLIVFGVLGSLAGGSFPFSGKLGKKGESVDGVMPISLTFLPELLIAALLAFTAVDVYEAVLGDIGFKTSLIAFLVSGGISYAGIQAATWGMLNWQNKHGHNPKRSAKIKPIVDFISRKLGFSFGSEGYAWTWAGVKGFITTLPLGGFGAITFPLGFELGSHADGRLKRPNMYREFFSYAGIGLVAIIIKNIFGT